MLTCEEHVTYSEEDGLLRFAMFYLDGEFICSMDMDELYALIVLLNKIFLNFDGKQFLDGGKK